MVVVAVVVVVVVVVVGGGGDGGEHVPSVLLPQLNKDVLKKYSSKTNTQTHSLKSSLPAAAAC